MEIELNYINYQDRGHNGSYTFEISTGVAENTSTSTRAVNQAAADRLLLPYPESELVQNPLLKQTPVNYNFTEEKITDLFN